MTRLRLLVLLLLLVAVAGVAALGAGREWFDEALRSLVEREVGAALHAPCALDGLSLSLVPPRVVVRGLRLGADGSIARLEEVTATLRPRTSLRQRRPVLDVAVAAIALDLPALLHALPPAPPGPAAPLPPFRIRRLVAADVRIRLTGEPHALAVAAPRVEGRVTVDAASGRLRCAARLESATIARDDRSLTLASVEARGGESADGWRLRHVAVRGDGVTLNGNERDATLHLDGEIELARLALLDEALQVVHGTAHLDGVLSGPLERPVLSASVTIPGLAVGDRAVGDVRVEARLDADELAVTAAHLRAAGGEVEATASLHLDATAPATARIAWRGLGLRDLIGPGAGGLPAATLGGAAEVVGTLDPLRLSGSGSGRVDVPGGAPALLWAGRGQFADGAGGGTIELTQAGGNALSADVRVDAARALAGQLRLRLADLDALGALVAVGSLPDVRGAVDATATLAGSLDDPRLQGGIDGRGVLVSGVRIDSVAGAFSADRRAVQVNELRAALAGGVVTARGTVALDGVGANAWGIDAKGIDGGGLSTLVATAAGVRLPIAGGAFTLAATADGPWPRVRLAGSAHLDDFWLGRERIARAGVEVRATDGRWTLEAGLRNRAGQQASLRASGRGADDVRADLDCPGWTLTSLWRGEQADLGGTVRATASLSGPARALSGSARVSADELVVGGRALGTLQVDVRAERGRWRASTALLDGALRVDADVRPDPGLPFAIESTWQQADAARLLGAPPELHLTSSGSLRVSGRLDAVERFDARVDVTELALTGGVKAVTADVPVNVICRQGRCSLDRLTLRSGEAALRLGGEAGVDGRVRLTLAGGGTLALLELVGEPIESARGTFAVDATISHGPSGWSLRGAVDLDKVALDAGLPVAVTRGGGRLVLDGEVIRIEGLQGRIGTGRFAIGGQIDLRQGPAVTWTLSDVGADPLPSLEVELSGQGTVDGTWQALRVAGAIHIGQLLYDRNLALTDFLPTFNRALAAAPRPRGEREVHLALTVEAPGQLYIENNLARMEARARLSIGGTAARPVIDGRVEALDGEVFLRGRTFELLGATVDFRPDLGMAAALNLTAESLIETSDGAYVVGVRVTGTTAEPRVVLTSDDPGLSQTDIATLIAFGRTTAQMRRQGGSFSLTGVLGFGTEQVGDLLAGEAERVLPVDRIEFEPTFSTTTGAFEPQLTIGKDLTDNLSASVGQTFGVSSRTRVEVEYRLGPRVSVPLLWETQTEAEAGAFGGGVRLRYEFWRLTPWTLLSGLR